VKKNLPEALSLSLQNKNLNYYSITYDPFKDCLDSTTPALMQYIKLLKDNGVPHLYERLVSNISIDSFAQVIKLKKENTIDFFELFTLEQNNVYPFNNVEYKFSYYRFIEPLY